MIYFKLIAFFNLYILHIIFISFIFTNKNGILKKHEFLFFLRIELISLVKKLIRNII